MTREVLATVVILTYNGERYLRRILEALRLQTELSGEIEVLIIDSGSTDSTIEIIREFPEVRVHCIPNHEFQHGRTRNLAAKLAQGEFVAYLTHDAVPLGPHWLANLLAPFSISSNVVAVVGKQAPRAHCFPLLKYEIRGVFAGLGADHGITLYQSPPGAIDEGMIAGLGFYSDVNSAARRATLVGSIPYREVDYAEDQLFGQAVIRAGLIKAYASGAAVEHSNDLSLSEYGKRIFDETVGLRKIGYNIPEMTKRAQLTLTLRGIVGDTARILRDPAYRPIRKLYWLVLNPVFQVRKWSSYRPASTVALDDALAIAGGSLEASRR